VNIPQKDIKAFQTKILSWYKKNKRDLPWRETRDPYRILVSEVMLQQTQVSRVIPKYEAWLDAFPTIEALANAKTSEVLRLWSGLGYNRRALYLQKTAKALQELRISNYELRNEKDTYWPKTIEALKKLPGIGEYTAAAVACFAFDQQVAVVDTNVRKVILTKLRINNYELRMTEKEIQGVADSLLPKGRAYEWNQALMDYASAMLKQEKIPLVKQSAFKNSNRYYRGQIIKILLEKKEVTVQELNDVFQKEETFVNGIVQGLVKDGMITVTGEQLAISH